MEWVYPIATIISALAAVLMPTSMRGFKGRLTDIEQVDPFSFTKGMRLLRIPARGNLSQPVGGAVGDLLYDVHADARQQTQVDDLKVVERLSTRMAELMRECDAPPEQFVRMGLPELKGKGPLPVRG